jgi:hypothetical protein
MRYTVHAERPGCSRADKPCSSVIEALGHASQLIAAGATGATGATGVYIYDDFQDHVYWPDHFPKLMPLGALARADRH